jgi:hypothetical protein
MDAFTPERTAAQLRVVERDLNRFADPMTKVALRIVRNTSRLMGFAH